MRIANHTEALEARFGALAAVRMNLEAGFEAVDYSMYNADGAVFSAGGILLARELRRLAASCAPVRCLDSVVAVAEQLQSLASVRVPDVLYRPRETLILLSHLYSLLPRVLGVRYILRGPEDKTYLKHV